MSGIALSYNIDLHKVQAMYGELSRADHVGLLSDIGAYMLSETQLNFDQEQTPEGEAWTDSSRAGKTLQDRGHLRDSYTYNVSLSGESVEIGSNLQYAAIHHEGGTIKAKNGGYLKFKIGDEWVQVKQVEIPARPALGITPEYEDEIGHLVNDFYEGIVNGY